MFDRVIASDASEKRIANAQSHETVEYRVAPAENSGAEVSVMAPMVATAEEAEWFVARARAAGIGRAGVMIEVPAAALTAREIFAVTD